MKPLESPQVSSRGYFDMSKGWTVLPPICASDPCCPGESCLPWFDISSKPDERNPEFEDSAGSNSWFCMNPVIVLVLGYSDVDRLEALVYICWKSGSLANCCTSWSSVLTGTWEIDKPFDTSTWIR